MTKYFEKGKWLLEFTYCKMAFDLLAHKGDTELFWIRNSKMIRTFEFSIMKRTIVEFKY